MTTNTPAITPLRVSALTISKGNVRKSKASPEEDAELRAGILAVGVLNALLVKHAGHNSTGADRYVVVAGGRRLAALEHLIKEKKLPADQQVSCIILDPDADEGAIGLIENGQRAGMHPIDEYEAYHDLHFKQHMTVADIAAQHGKSQLEVKKRLALGGVHPDIRAECRAGKIDVDHLEYYAATNNQEKQLKVYKSLKKQGSHNWGYKIREAFEDDSYCSDDDIVKFIGVDLYKEQGGACDEDLFTKDNDGTALRLLDKKLVEQLALAKLEAAALKHGKGWKWVKAELEFSLYQMPYSRIYAEKGGFTDKQKEQSGVVVTIKHGGHVEVHKGLVRKGDESAAKSASKGGKAGKDKAKVGAAGYSQAVKDDLDYHKLAATKLALLDLADPALLVSAMHFAICSAVFEDDRFADATGMSMQCEPGAVFLSTSGREIEAHLDEKLEAHLSKLSLAWREQPTAAMQFQAFLKLPDLDQARQAAFCAARMMTSSDMDHNPGPDLMLKELGANLANYWRPTASTFFSRVPQGERLRIAAVVLGEKEAPAELKKMKSAALSKYLEDKVREMPAEKCWLPDGFEIQEPKPPKGKAKAKGKAPAKEKRSAASRAAALEQEDDGDD